MKKSTTMFDFFKRKYSNSSEVNVGLPITNVTIPIPENMDVPILENIYYPIPKNVDVPIPRNIHSPILENANISIPENNHISQTQFQKVNLDILRNDFWVFFLVDSLLILYGWVFGKKKIAYLRPPLAWNLGSVPNGTTPKPLPFALDAAGNATSVANLEFQAWNINDKTLLSLIN